jgi:hypothetical protein
MTPSQLKRTVVASGIAALACQAAGCSLVFPLDNLGSGGLAIQGPHSGATDEGAADEAAPDVGSDTDLYGPEGGVDAMSPDVASDASDASVEAVADAAPYGSVDVADGGGESASSGCDGNCIYPVGGTIVGISPGDTVQIESQGGAPSMMTADGAFELDLPDGSAYNITATGASSPIPEKCTVEGGQGTVTGPVNDVKIYCLPTDVLYYFPLDGNPNDLSGNGNNAVVTGGVWPTADRFGNSGGAYHFDGTTGSLSAPGSLLPINAASRTLTVWVEPAGMTDAYGVVSWGSNNCTATTFGLGIKNGETAILWEGCNDGYTTLDVVPNVWSFVAIVFSADEPETYTFYVNGQVANLQLKLPPATQRGPLVMGSNDSTSGSLYFHGNLDSVRVYGRPLTASEIAGIFASP